MNAEPGIYDLLVVGGGINGVGIALDAAGRGLQVLLCDMNDLGSATSSNSSKLLHGGLRYLEHYEFGLVRKGLAEREILLKKAPHIIRPLRFRLPHQPHLRPAWMIQAGLFLYDHLSTRTSLAGSKRIRFGPDSPLQQHITQGFEYSDAWVDDARLVILNAVAARDQGATIYSRCRCIQARRSGKLWQISLQHQRSGVTETLSARALVNATGPWVAQLFESALASRSPKPIRLVKGSHIVVPRLHDQPEAYILQNEDQRILFVIPYEQDFSLIGTTDVDYQGDPSQATISDAETDYLLSIVNRYFNHQSSRADIVMSYAGVRPLLDDQSSSAQAVTRDSSLVLEQPSQQAPLLSIFGGKITTYRKLAETAVDTLSRYFPGAGPAWTRSAPLPGGDFTTQKALLSRLLDRYPWLAEPLACRLVRSYGTLSEQLLAGATQQTDLGQHFGAGLYQREVDYLTEQEWALTVEDILWRRSKLGLRLKPQQQQQLAEYLHQTICSSAQRDPADLSE